MIYVSSCEATLLKTAAYVLKLYIKFYFESGAIRLSIYSKIVRNHNGDINALGSSENRLQFNIIVRTQIIRTNTMNKG